MVYAVCLADMDVLCRIVPVCYPESWSNHHGRRTEDFRIKVTSHCMASRAASLQDVAGIKLGGQDAGSVQTRSHGKSHADSTYHGASEATAAQVQARHHLVPGAPGRDPGLNQHRLGIELVGPLRSAAVQGHWRCPARVTHLAPPCWDTVSTVDATAPPP